MKSQVIAFYLLLGYVLCACNHLTSQPTEVTASHAPVLTSTLLPTPTSTPPLPCKWQVTATWYLKTATPILPTPPPDDIGYYEGIVTITQYYTYLGHGLYKEAYQLLSSSSKACYPFDEYIENKKMWFKKVEIISIVPRHPKFQPDSMNRRKYFVSFIAWGEGRFSGSAMSGEVQTGDLVLVKEDGEWKIEIR